MIPIPSRIEQRRRRRLAIDGAHTAAYVQERLNNGPLTAKEIIEGVRLEHEDFLMLWRHAQRSLVLAEHVSNYRFSREYSKRK